MRSRLPFRLLLAVVLTTGMGIATEVLPAAAGTSSREATSAPAKKAKKKKPAVKLADSTFGKILVSGKTGKTLYAFQPDGTDTSASKCTGGCAGLWPPATAKKAVAGKGLDKQLLTLGVNNQLAYNNHLLYEFANDAAPGDTNGQGFADIWHVVNAAGEPVTG